MSFTIVYYYKYINTSYRVRDKIVHTTNNMYILLIKIVVARDVNFFATNGETSLSSKYI